MADARGLFYHPRISNHSYPGRQVPLASTTRGSPLAVRGGTMGGNGGQMMPGICAANLRHGTDNFTSFPKEGVLRIFIAF
jgi:hypothetical protein